MPNDVIQCGNCGHETPAESIYCENCGVLLKEVLPERPVMASDPETQAPVPTEETPGFSADDLNQDALSPMQSMAPPPFADVVGLEKGSPELEHEAENAAAFGLEHEDAFGSESWGAAEDNTERGAESNADGSSKLKAESNADGRVERRAESSVGDNVKSRVERESISRKDEPYYSLDGYIGPATLETQLPPIPAFQIRGDEYSPVDPQSAPYQPKLGVFRTAVVGLMGILFGIAIVLLFCLVVMHLLGI